MIDLTNRRIALIGGAGFIGHNLALDLTRRGAQVEVVDSLQVNNLLSFTASHGQDPWSDLYLRIIHQRLEALQNAKIPLHIQDARDYHALSHVLHQIRPHVIIHLAAVAHAGKSNKDPYSTFDHSLRTLENALDYARGGKVEHFVYFSSSMVYGNFMTPEVSEEHPLNPIGIYGALKVAGEKMVIAYQQVFDLPYTIIRPSALYGKGCVSRRVGQVFIECALQGKPLRMDGDGSEKIDFTYIDDLVEGVALVLQNPASKNEIFNLTNGGSRSIQELAGIIRKQVPDVKIESVTRDKLMPFRGTLCIDKARQKLGFEPQFGIDVGIPAYIEWYRDLIPMATV